MPSGVSYMLWEPVALATVRSGFQGIIDYPRAIPRNATMTCITKVRSDE